jgi:hypothetical protein
MICGRGGVLVDVGTGIAVDVHVGSAAVGGGVGVQVGLASGVAVGSGVEVAVDVGGAAVGSGAPGVTETGVEVSFISVTSAVTVGFPVSIPISSVPRHPARSRDTASIMIDKVRFFIRLPPRARVLLTVYHILATGGRQPGDQSVTLCYRSETNACSDSVREKLHAHDAAILED